MQTEVTLCLHSSPPRNRNLPRSWPGWGCTLMTEEGKMTKLHELLAISKNAKNGQNKAVTDHYHWMQKTALFNGMIRIYTAKDDDGEQLAPESVLVQKKVPAALDTVRGAFSRLMEVQASIDVTNMQAAAAVVIDGVPLTPFLPATHLLWLEKQLTDLRTVITSIPTLDPQYQWTWDDVQELWATEELKTSKMKKVFKNHVKAPATDKHPAQVDVFAEDVPVGTWSTRKLSSAVPARDVAAMAAKVDRVLEATKMAREQANNVDVEKSTSDGVLDYIFR